MGAATAPRDLVFNPTCCSRSSLALSCPLSRQASLPSLSPTTMSSGSREVLPVHSPFADNDTPRQSVAATDDSVAATTVPNASAAAENLQPDTPPTPYSNPFSPPETPARNSYIGDAGLSPNPSRPILSEDANRNGSGAPLTEAGVLSEKPRLINSRRRLFIWLGVGAAAIVVIVLAVVLPVYFTVIKKNSSGGGGGGSGSSGGSSGGDSTNPESPTGATSGGDGSVITLSDGTSFTYSNRFGGFCASLHSRLIPTLC